MPRKCCVPGCKGNYNSEDEVVSVFRFPTDCDKRRLWLCKIPRDNFEPSKNSVVCEKHFIEEFIVRFDSATRPDGSVLTVKRTNPKLREDAYPSIFLNCPAYLSEQPPTKRKRPDDRRAEMDVRDEQSFANWLEADKIQNFQEFSDNFKGKIPSNSVWMYRDCRLTTQTTLQYWSFYVISDSHPSLPELQLTVRVHSDLHVEVFSRKIGRIPQKDLRWLFGKGTGTSDSSRPVLSSWSQFDSLLSHFADFGTTEHCFKTQLQLSVNVLSELSSGDLTENDDIGEETVTKLQFLVEQLKHLQCHGKRYSYETLLWSFKMYIASPKAYSILRDSLLSLPHSSYLRKLCSCFKVSSGLKQNSVHMEYLKQKCKNLAEKERYVCLMIDEIHISAQLSYKEGKLEGSAVNCPLAEATSAQVFLISSYMSKNKDVAAIIPVKNLNASLLHDTIFEVLKILHNTGFTVGCIISDNNYINRNAFKILSGGVVKTWIPNPHDANEKMFLFLDSVHIFKCIRNNWLSQKDVDRTFIFPSFSDNDVVQKASFAHLIKLFTTEQASTLKLAPSLNHKALHPTTTEKQNVHLMLKVFDSRNVIALEHYENQWKIDTLGTRTFISHFCQLWDILNVKKCFKEVRLRKPACKAIASMTDQNILILRKTLEWLQEWQKLNLKVREGVLSKETMAALQHTLLALLDMSGYLLEAKKFDFVLLGKFQTDNLEFRFSQYRQLSGSNYHVSVQQLLESEKKLKLISTLKMISASNGTLNLKDMTEPLEEAKNQSSTVREEEFAYFLSLFDDDFELDINPEQHKVLIFIAGYCVSKQIRFIDCTSCASDLRVDKALNVETSQDCFNYIAALDRGALIWPSDYIVEIISAIFRLFQFLIKSPEHEKKFLSSSNQRKILKKLSFEQLSKLGLLNKHCEMCGKCHNDFVTKCCGTVVNILLNNYSKNFTDNAITVKAARKLKTFTKRQ